MGRGVKHIGRGVSLRAGTSLDALFKGAVYDEFADIMGVQTSPCF